MKPEVRSHLVVGRPQLVVLALLVAAGTAHAQADTTAGGKSKDKRGSGPSPTSNKKTDAPKVFDFTGIEVEGRLRTPQLLYFLDRAAEELERASLERRSFLREVVRSIDEEEL